MKERPILFSEAMVRAILDGRKTQTRRVMKPQPEPIPKEYKYNTPGHWYPSNMHKKMLHIENALQNKDGIWEGLAAASCPYGGIGDRLWVRETWSTNSVLDNKKPSELRNCKSFHYWADGEKETGKKRPSIFMPREASRINLEITGIRVERLNDISEEDAIAEGVDGEKEAAATGATWFVRPKTAYRYLWNKINGANSWDLNPWVWVIEFKQIKIL